MHNIAYFGAGCFWGVETYFRKINGVTDVCVGYMGGTTENPTYKDVCTGRTNHAEVVKVTFDMGELSYETLVDRFFQCHDPTQVNRQGADVGSQYRSVIFYMDILQQNIAEKVLRKTSPMLARPIATEIERASAFWIAEEYHQNYFAKNKGGCHI